MIYEECRQFHSAGNGYTECTEEKVIGKGGGDVEGMMKVAILLVSTSTSTRAVVTVTCVHHGVWSKPAFGSIIY